MRLGGRTDEATDDFRPSQTPGDRQLVLLNLWASWCKPCLQELAELTAGGADLQAAGLDLVALSVDGIDGQPSPSAAELDALLERLKFPFQNHCVSANLNQVFVSVE